MEVPLVDRVERLPKANALGIGGERLLRQAKKVHHQTHGAVRAVTRSKVFEIRLEEFQQASELRPQPVRVPKVQPRVRQYEHRQLTKVSRNGEAPHRARGEHSGVGNVLAARDGATQLYEVDDPFEVNERRLLHELRNGAATAQGPGIFWLLLCVRHRL